VKFVKLVNPLEVLAVVAVEIIVFWDVTLCSVSKRYQHFIGTCFLRLKAMRNSVFHQDLGVLLPKYMTLLTYLLHGAESFLRSYMTLLYNIIRVNNLKIKMNLN
jgi:hypothetical protein